MWCMLQAWSIIFHNPLVIAGGPEVERCAQCGQRLYVLMLIENLSHFYGM